MKTSPKKIQVLRIGVTQGGKLLKKKDDEIVRDQYGYRKEVTIGRSPDCWQQVKAEGLPEKFPIFDNRHPMHNDVYHLRLLPGMEGRIIMFGQKGPPKTLADCIKTATKYPGGKENDPLNGSVSIPMEGSRGKVVVGDTTFLWQFISMDAPKPRQSLLRPAVLFGILAMLGAAALLGLL